MCRKHTCFLSLWASLILLSIGIIVVGSIITIIVNDKINSTLKQYLPINQGVWDYTSWNKYLNGSTTVDYYLWNVTNLRDVLLTGAVPVMNAVGPIRFNHWSLKVQVDTSDSSTIKYNTVDTYEVLDQDSKNYLDASIMIINPAYMAGIVGVGQAQSLAQAQALAQTNQQGGFINGQWYPKNNVAMDDTLLNTYFVGNVLSGLYPNLQNPSSTLITSIQGLAVPIYFKACLLQLSDFLVKSKTVPDQATANATVFSQWANAGQGGTFASKNSFLQVFSGFELPSPGLGNQSLALATALWSQDPSVPYSLYNNILFWSNLKSTDPAVLGKTVVTLLTAFGKYGLTQAGVVVIGNWLSKLLVFGNKNYEKIVLAALTVSLSNFYTWYSAAPSLYALSKWADLGALQFGTGVLPALLADLKRPAGSTSAGAPSSLLADPIAGPLLRANNITFAFEFAAIVNPVPTSPTLFRLSNKNSTLLLSILGGAITGVSPNGDTSTATLIYGAVYSILKQICPLSTFSTTKCASIPWSSTLFTTYVNGAIQVNPTLALVKSPLLQLSSLFDVQGFGPYLYYYTNAYFAYGLTGSLTALDSMGATAQNTGLFVKITGGEALFGFNYLTTFVPGIIGDWSILSPSLYNPKYYYSPSPYASRILSPSQQIIAQTAAGKGFINWHRTCQDSLDTCGQYSIISGVSGFKYYCDYYDPSGINPTCGTEPDRSLSNNQIWGTYEVLAGTVDGLSMAPFKEGDSNIVPSIKFFVSQLKRSVPFVYNYSWTYKGINVRRYNVDPNFLANYVPGATGTSNNVYRNDAYYFINNAPDGLLPLATVYGGVPLYASKGHMYGVDPSISGVKGMNPTESLHDATLDIEPLTGKTMFAAKRLQASFRVAKAEYAFNGFYSNMFANRNYYYIPYYWADEHGSISDDDANTFTTQIYGNRNAAALAQCILLCFGIFGFLLFIGLFIYEIKVPAGETKRI